MGLIPKVWKSIVGVFKVFGRVLSSAQVKLQRLRSVYQGLYKLNNKGVKKDINADQSVPEVVLE